MVDLNYKYLKSLGFIDYTYENISGGAGLITYQDISVKLQQEIVRFWISEFITKENNVLINGPVLTPKLVLSESGHLTNMAYELFNITPDIYLRPETCQTIFSYYKSTYGRLIKDIGIGQIGLSFRNEITTRTNLLRLKEFTQLQLEIFSTCKNQKTIIIANKTYEISQILFKYVTLTTNFFIKLGLKTTLIWKEDKPHYSKATIDFMYNDIQLASLNDRGNFDIPSVKTGIYEVSIGLGRVFLCILFNLIENDGFCQLLTPNLGVVYDCEYSKISEVLGLVKSYAAYKYKINYKNSINLLQKLKCKLVLIINKELAELKIIDDTKNIREWKSKIIDLDQILVLVKKANQNLNSLLFF